MIGTLTGREIQLAGRPLGWPNRADFLLVEEQVPDIGPGQLLVRNLVMSVDPYMRNRMNAIRSYVSSYRLGHPLEGGAVGRVLTSNSPDFAAGDLVVHELGWRDYAVVDAARAGPAGPAGPLPPRAMLGLLGLPGQTAYAGLVDVGGVRPGDTVLVSSAAGAVGTIAGQIARLRGAARVIGSTGSPQKAGRLMDLGYDATVNYRDGALDRQLAGVAPDGVDVYFDNVGGDHLEAALSVMNPHGRIAACGMIAQYNATDLLPGPRNLMQVVSRRLTLRGFLMTDFEDRRAAIREQLLAWVGEGRLTGPETLVHGLDNAPEASIRLLRGDYFGKVFVTIDDDVVAGDQEAGR